MSIHGGDRAITSLVATSRAPSMPTIGDGLAARRSSRRRLAPPSVARRVSAVRATRLAVRRHRYRVSLLRASAEIWRSGSRRRSALSIDPLHRRCRTDGSSFDASGEPRPELKRRRTGPLADRLRPRALDEVVGQDHLLGSDGTLTRMLERGSLASLILWGPPGVGKTTIARLLAERAGLHFVQLSAVFSGVADLKRAFEEAGAAPARRAGHAAVRRRDPPLQPRPAGRVPAGGRGRHRHPGRRHDRKPVLRAERRAAVALPGAGAAAAGRRGAGTVCWPAPRRKSAAPLPLHAGRARHAAGDGGWRRALPAEHGRADRWPCRADTPPLDAAALADAARPARGALRQGSRGALQPDLRAA